MFFSLGSRSKSRSSGGAVTLTSQVAQAAFLAWLEVNQNRSRLKGKVITCTVYDPIAMYYDAMRGGTGLILGYAKVYRFHVKSESAL